MTTCCQESSLLRLENGAIVRTSNFVSQSMRGGSASLLVCDTQADLWVTKFEKNPQHFRVVQNELLATHIARTIGLTVPETTIIDVTHSTLTDWRSVNGGRTRPRLTYECGLQFGSRYVAPIARGPSVTFVTSRDWSRVTNAQERVGVLLLDLWLCNTDGRQAVFSEAEEEDKLKAFWIDFGHAFGEALWQLEQAPLWRIVNPHPALATLKGWSDVNTWTSRIAAFSLNSLYELFLSMPACWRSGLEADFDDLLVNLEHRRSKLEAIFRDVVSVNTSTFLSWRKDPRATHF